jgi:hypothetical protein
MIYFAGSQSSDHFSVVFREQNVTMKELSRPAEVLSSIAGGMKAVIDEFILDSISKSSGKTGSSARI